MRYVVYKQPLSLDRFFVYDISLPESVSCRLEYAFVLVVMNRFQQVVTIHSFQTSSDHIKVGTRERGHRWDVGCVSLTMNFAFQQNWVTKLKETQEKWKKTLENTMYRASSPQDIRNPNPSELSVNECMNSYFRTPSGVSMCSRSNISVYDSTADLCSTIDQSSPIPESYPTRQSSAEEESQSFTFSAKVSPSATKHKKSF